MGSYARMDPKLPQNFGTWPGLPLQLLARNQFLHSDKPTPPPLMALNKKSNSRSGCKNEHQADFEVQLENRNTITRH